MPVSPFILVSATYPPHVGGVDNYTSEMVQALLRRGERVILVTSAINGLPGEEHTGLLTIRRIPTKWLVDMRLPIILPGKAWRKLKKELKREQDARVLIQTYLYPLSLAMAFFSFRQKWFSILLCHGSQYVCSGSGFVDRVEHLYERIMARLVGAFSQKCCAVSNASGAWLRALHLPFSGTLPPAIDLNMVRSSLAACPTMRAEGGLLSGDGVIRIAFVGRMIREKGICQLIDAVGILREQGYPLTLTAMGDGPLLDELRDNAPEGVHFTGRLSRAEVLRQLAAHDCFCLPSDSEGFPLSAVEAAACGCYEILAPVGGAAELIPDISFGYPMRGNSREDIIDAIKYVFENRTQCAYAAQKCKERILQAYSSWENACSQLIAAFDRS